MIYINKQIYFNICTANSIFNFIYSTYSVYYTDIYILSSYWIIEYIVILYHHFFYKFETTVIQEISDLDFKTLDDTSKLLQKIQPIQILQQK